MLGGTNGPYFGKGSSVRVKTTQSIGPGVAAHADGGRVKDWKSREILLRFAFSYENNAS